jgi:Fe-S-cluster containining protein
MEIKNPCESCNQACCREPFKQLYTRFKIDQIIANHDYITPENKSDFFTRKDEVLNGIPVSYFITNKRNDGSCVFLNEQGLCSIYLDRSLDCKTYPVIFEYDTSTNEVTIYLDQTPDCRDGTPLFDQNSELVVSEVDKIEQQLREELVHWTRDELIAYTYMPPSTTDKDTGESAKLYKLRSFILNIDL